MKTATPLIIMFCVAIALCVCTYYIGYTEGRLQENSKCIQIIENEQAVYEAQIEQRRRYDKLY